MYDLPALEPQIAPTIIIQEKVEQEPPKQHLVLKGETLTSVSQLYNTPIERIWAANPQLSHPDQLNVSEVLILPENTDVLPERPYPAMIEVPNRVVTQRTPATRGGSSYTGRFPYGYCTFFAAQQRPDLKVYGNAGEWIRWSNGKEPRVGAVAVNTWAAGYGHVAIVLDFNATQVLVKHMNYSGFGKITTDWIDRSYWAGYIY